MNLDETIRNRNNKMRPEDVISFYRQALLNNRNRLTQAIRENNTKEIKRISIFIERGERELSYAETRLTRRAADEFSGHANNCVLRSGGYACTCGAVEATRR